MVDELVKWCDEFFLLNTTRTKDMVIDFRRNSPHSRPQTVNKCTAIKFVDMYKYLGIVTDNRLKSDANTEAICKKGQQCLYFLKKLNIFNVERKMMSLFD